MAEPPTTTSSMPRSANNVEQREASLRCLTVGSPSAVMSASAELICSPVIDQRRELGRLVLVSCRYSNQRTHFCQFSLRRLVDPLCLNPRYGGINIRSELN